jgi:hypothetical protein
MELGPGRRDGGVLGGVEERMRREETTMPSAAEEAAYLRLWRRRKRRQAAICSLAPLSRCRAGERMPVPVCRPSPQGYTDQG